MNMQSRAKFGKQAEAAAESTPAEGAPPKAVGKKPSRFAPKVPMVAQMLTVRGPQWATIDVPIESFEPHVMENFGAKAAREMYYKQMAGDPVTEDGEKKIGVIAPPKSAKDFEQMWHDYLHISEAGWYGIPCAAFRGAMVAASVFHGVKLTAIKSVLVIMPDGREELTHPVPDSDMLIGGLDLVRIHGPAPIKHLAHVVNSGIGRSTDLRLRPMFQMYTAILRIKFLKSVLNPETVVNIVQTAGEQFGVGAGRMSSSKSVGMGWGGFSVVIPKAAKAGKKAGAA